MTNTNATNLRKNLFSYLDSTIEYNDIINVNTKKGNVIIISEVLTIFICIYLLKKIKREGILS